jgi:hypothetical protein
LGHFPDLKFKKIDRAVFRPVFKIPLQIGFRSMQLNFFSAPRVSLLALTVVGGTLGLSPDTAGDLPDFKSPRDNSPMTFPLQTGEVEMPAVKNFKATGVNEYRGNVDAVADSSMAAPAVRCSRSSAAACSRTRCSGLSPM